MWEVRVSEPSNIDVRGRCLFPIRYDRRKKYLIQKLTLEKDARSVGHFYLFGGWLVRVIMHEGALGKSCKVYCLDPKTSKELLVHRREWIQHSRQHPK